MFFHSDIKGDRLREVTLCLTYDDGPGRGSEPEDVPGPRTLELACFLGESGIAATFFVVGRFALKAVWSYLSRSGVAKPVTIHFFDRG